MKIRTKLILIYLLLGMEMSFAQTISRGPYLNMATHASIIIRWRTNIPCNSEIHYGLTKNALNSVIINNANVIDHGIQLSGLQADTKYFYAVGASGTILQSSIENYFTTLPIASVSYDKPIRFWAIGDMAKQTQQEIDVREAFKKYVDTNQVHGFILLGDNAYNSGFDADYQLGFFNYFQHDLLKHIPIWPVLGNHDYNNDYSLRQSHAISYLDIFTLPENGEIGGVASGTERYYSFNYGNVHFVHLDSYGLENVSGNYYGLADTMYSPQVNWLRSDLAANQMPWTIVCFHHPPYCMGTHNSDNEMDLVYIRTHLSPILERYNVDLVLNGHCHTYQRSRMMKNYVGMESDFDPIEFNRQSTSGKYDGTANSCPYIKNTVVHEAKDSGVIYMVIGSGSAVPQAPQAAWPHDAMYYSNYADNGSLLLTVEGSRLDAEWISTDTADVIKDRLTIYKNRKSFEKIILKLPAPVTIKASWNSPYSFSWNTGETTQTMNAFVTKDSMFTVTDSMSCITDTFLVVDSASSLGIVNNDAFIVNYFPNPITNKLTIQLPHSGEYICSLFTENGQQILRRNFRTNTNSFSLDIENTIVSGIYFVELQEKNKPFLSKRKILIEQK